MKKIPSGLRLFLGFSLLLLGCPGLRAQESAADSLLLHFDFNRSELRPADSLRLAAWLEKSREHFQILAVEINGYCDGRGSKAYNDQLSLARVRKVWDWLRSRLPQTTPYPLLKGWGKSRPVADNGQDSGRALNRRVEVLIRRQALPPPATPPPATIAAKTPVTVTDTLHAPRAEDRQGQPNEVSLLRRDTSLVKVGASIPIRDLLFYGNRHIPLASSMPVLAQLLALMQEHPGLAIEIQGHICCLFNGADGPDIDNGRQDLSVQRAKFVYDYLKAQGIDAARMSYKGFASTRKIFPDELTEAQQQANRRVEIKILSWDFKK